MQRALLHQHLDECGQALGARFGFLRSLQSEEDGVAILAAERLGKKARAAGRFCLSSAARSSRNRRCTLAIVGAIPPSIGLGSLDFSQSGRLHASTSDESGSFVSI